jgi:hypothetical protein
MTISLKRGASRLWVVVSVLWVGLVGWSWADPYVVSWQGGCSLHDELWPPPHDPKIIPERNVRALYPIDLAPTLVHAVSLPAGLLAVWFVRAWIVRGFRRSPAE